MGQTGRYLLHNWGEVVHNYAVFPDPDNSFPDPIRAAAPYRVICRMNGSNAVPIPDYFYYFPKPNEQRTVTETRQSAIHSGKEETIHELHSSDGIFIWYGKVQLAEKKRMLVEYPSPFIHINFSLRCSSRYTSHEAAPPFAVFHPREYNIVWLPPRQTVVEWLPGEAVETFEINITPDFFQQQLPERHPFLAAMQHHTEPVTLSPQNLPITPAMLRIIYDMLHCKMEPAHKRVFLKAKTLELISLQLLQLSEMQAQLIPNSEGVRPADVQKMHLVRDIILQHLHNPHSLPVLAQMADTNECYLKRHFKKIFGTTVYGYIQQTRMEKAKHLLLHERKKVSEVALLSGYSHISHFSKAFRKHFGCSPQQIRLGQPAREAGQVL
ncbi:AraC family transcriptional regulator [Chitinophaga lutea]|uniref:AraC family transcriptional regulator n=2 Tax=Chitinophaga lutea TaxID=2488634 RepID=A0A3N4PKR0_9BACT|nr:AraC family transcriptional regulator [Chitinophaga lutea]